MTEAQLKLTSDRNIAFQEIVKAVNAFDAVRAIEQCRVALEKQEEIKRNNGTL